MINYVVWLYPPCHKVFDPSATEGNKRKKVLWCLINIPFILSSNLLRHVETTGKIPSHSITDSFLHDLLPKLFCFMKMHKTSLLAYLFCVVVLALAHLCSCRHLSRSGSEGTEERLRVKFSLPFPSRFGPSSYSPEFGDRINHQVFTVSDKVVPSGPNPLHNWVDFQNSLLLLGNMQVTKIGRQRKW